MSRQPYRLPKAAASTATRIVRFSFGGRTLAGHPGDTLASALLANGEHMVARSFKYHRPRGILGGGSGGSGGAGRRSAPIRARTDPNTRVTEQEIFEGLKARPQNCWPTLKTRCRRRRTTCVAPFIPAGFYYKTFKGGPGLDGLRAAHPPLRRARPRAERGPIPTATRR